MVVPSGILLVSGLMWRLVPGPNHWTWRMLALVGDSWQLSRGRKFLSSEVFSFFSRRRLTCSLF